MIELTGFVALYIFMLAAFVGYEVVSKVPVILHTALMSGLSFVHGVVLVGAMVVLGSADPDNTLHIVIGFVGVLLASANLAGGFTVTKRLVELFNGGNNHA